MNPSTKNDLKMLVFALIIYAIIMGLTSAGALNAFWQLNLIFAGINIILAASLNLINGYTGQFSLGHAGFMAVGAYVGVVLTTNFHLPFAAALLAGGIAAAGGEGGAGGQGVGQGALEGAVLRQDCSAR